MTDPKPDVCRNFAEQIYYSYPHFRTWFPEHKKEEIIKDLTDAIRNHTIVPEMVKLLETQTEFMASLTYTILSHELLRSVPAIKTLLDANKGLGAKCMSILAKAQGRE